MRLHCSGKFAALIPECFGFQKVHGNKSVKGCPSNRLFNAYKVNVLNVLLELFPAAVRTYITR